MSSISLRIGIDIGGTFTDFVVHDRDAGTIRTFKLLSTPADPGVAVLEGLQRIQAETKNPTLHIIHGSTVATNALLERKGARSALVTTRGFRDVLQIGRQNRPALYDLFTDPAPPLIPAELRFEVDERVDHLGSVLRSLDEADVERVVDEIHRQGIKSTAVCLLFSFLHPEHEKIIGEKLREKGIFVSLSAEILPEFREYERMSTTAVNAYVSPILDQYLSRLETSLDPTTTLRVMQSNGGTMNVEEARQFGVRCILSGPAGGVVGCDVITRNTFSAEDDDPIQVITFDMGGTSTDVSLIDGQPRITTEAAVGGCPVRIPLLDIHTIGAGGGSIARVDPGGALLVGPESAGANPGPACYGKGGTLPTVTDANLVLGRLQADFFLGGEMHLDGQAAREALTRLGAEMGMDPIRAALGVVQVSNAHMERALRVISVERGYDPRRFNLLSFGGAGGLHAVDLARNLGIPQVWIPPMASTLSAFGMLAADIVKDYTQTVMLPGDTSVEGLAACLEPLAMRGQEEMAAEDVSPEEILLQPSLDMRYRGQSYELNVPLSQTVYEDFHRIHEHQYGYAKQAGIVEIVNLRMRAIGKAQPLPLSKRNQVDADSPLPKPVDVREVLFSDGPRPTPLYRAETLLPGQQLPGSAIVVRSDTTILLGPGDRARVDAYENLIIQVAL